MAAVAMAQVIDAMRGGPRAAWSPPPPVAVAAGLAESPTVLFIGARPPVDLAEALGQGGWGIDAVNGLDDARHALRTRLWSLIIADPDQPEDVVVWAVALKAGHAIASGVPWVASRLPVVLLPPPGENQLVALTRSGEAREMGSDLLVRIVLTLLSDGAR